MSLFMPLQRKSCEPCFLGKRRCDAKYPSCSRCQKYSKVCHYLYSPVARDTTTVHTQPMVATSLLTESFESAPGEQYGHESTQDAFPDALDIFTMIQDLVESEANLGEYPDMVETLGGVRYRSDASQSWHWVHEQLQTFPKEFAMRGENIFLKMEMYTDELPSAIRLAFGLCSASLCATDANRSIFLQSLNDTITEVLQYPVLESQIEDDLARLQAILLCEILRSAHGGLRERALAEQQMAAVETRGLQLLQKAKEDNLSLNLPSWGRWILQECVRRTVMIMFLLHSLESVSKHGICLQIPILSKLPVSLNARCWTSQSEYAAELDATLSYSEFTNAWISSPTHPLDTFDRLILVACKGLDWVSRHGQRT